MFPNGVIRHAARYCLLALLLATAAASGETQAAPKPSATHLLTEYLGNPLGIDVPQPRFSWQFVQDVRGARQSAYQIQVADSLDALKSGKANVWDSGKVFSSQTVNIALPASGGLRSGMRCCWRVKVWDANGAANDSSGPAWFEMGLLNKEDWQGVWLTAPVSAGSPFAAPFFRFEFGLQKPVKHAQAYVAGLGYCELHLNGRKVGDRVLDPAYTTYTKRVLYSTYDVTGQVNQGRNAIGAVVGKGWYSGSPCLIAQLNVEFEDGTRASITTNRDWKHSLGPILDNSIYHGETYDARLQQPGWDSPGFDDSKWQPALEGYPPTEKLSAQMIQPIRVVETIKPRKLRRLAAGAWVFDFGQNFSGWCRLTVSGPAGTEVVLKHAEILNPNGTINQANLRSAKATDRYILKGKEVEVYEPRFTYHGFRYVQIDGFPGRPSLGTLLGCVVHTDFPRRGAFECSDQLINKIQSNSVWGYRTNFHSIPTDCPQRDERQGWLGDAQSTSDMAFYNFDTAAAYTKYLQDIQDVQGADGRIPDTVPHVYGGNPGDPMWAGAYLFIAWDMYRHSGDGQLLGRHYEGFKRYVDMLAREAKDYILVLDQYGDWLSPIKTKEDRTPKDLIATCAFYRSVWIAARAAEILGHPDDAKRYNDLCAKIARAFNAKFLNPATNNYGNGSQLSNAFPLYLGIVPEDRRKAVAENLVNDVMVNWKGHLSTGFVGTRLLMDVLCDEGHPDVAYTIVTQRDYPGWGYMIENGATTIWERWDLRAGLGMNSHNHPDLGSVSGWFYRMVAGIMPRDETPGYERFDIKPFAAGDLKEAKASINTIRGPAASHWKRDESGISLNVIIPANSQASVWVPKLGLADVEVKEGPRAVWRGGKFIPGVAGIDSASDAGDWIKFEAGSGTYSFRLEPRGGARIFHTILFRERTGQPSSQPQGLS
ncbi:MAG TPA: family 78 glycoside hydrolase catalytic domain [Armatimonadota bacterium]|nr:family 78 glycoside hydrolase catalytic domain [Armatimonadota bacterium]